MNTPETITVKKPAYFKKHFEFWHNNELLGEINYPSGFKSDAIITIGDKKWLLKKTGFWKTKLEIKAEQSPYTLESYPINWNNKLELRYQDGNTYKMKRTAVFKAEYTWLDAQQKPVITIISRSHSKSERGKVQIHRTPIAAYMLLLMIGWYTVIHTEEQSAAVIAST